MKIEYFPNKKVEKMLMNVTDIYKKNAGIFVMYIEIVQFGCEQTSLSNQFMKQICNMIFPNKLIIYNDQMIPPNE